MAKDKRDIREIRHSRRDIQEICHSVSGYRDMDSTSVLVSSKIPLSI